MRERATMSFGGDVVARNVIDILPQPKSVTCRPQVLVFNFLRGKEGVSTAAESALTLRARNHQSLEVAFSMGGCPASIVNRMIPALHTSAWRVQGGKLQVQVQTRYTRLCTAAAVTRFVLTYVRDEHVPGR